MEWDSTLLDEDDSLLQPTPARIANCISPMKHSRITENSRKGNCSSSKDTSNKENVTVNKCEGQKLNVETVQMKKKRKGRGYNLRKSLAWDRAFFTEEGVLDPLELSMISGTLVNSPREGLSTINEDDSLSNDCQSNIDSADLQALEKNLFKEVPAVSLTKDTVHLPPKNSPAHAYQASTSLASTTVLPTRGANRAGSRGGSCPRPFPLSSLKRPANAHASQAVTKESKLPRIPVSRPAHSSTLLSNKSAAQSASNVKQKQITQRAVIIQNQRNVASKSSPKSVKHNLSKSKAGSGFLSVKASASRSKRNVVNSSIYPHSFSQLNPPTEKKVPNTGLKVILDDVGPSIAVSLSEFQDCSTKLKASLPHDTSSTSSTKQHKQFPPIKPSGLRMPSPSLGFFGQPKSSVPHCASQRAVEAGLRKPGYLKPPHSPMRVFEVVNDTMQTVDTVVLRSGSDVQAVSHESIKQNVGKDATKKGLNFSNEDRPSETMNDKKAIHCNSGSSILGCEENRISTGSHWEKSGLLPQQNTVKCAKGVSRTRNSIENSSSSLQDLNRVSEEHGDFESSNGDAVRITCEDEHLVGGKGSYDKDSQNHSSENLENADSEPPACMENEQKNSGSSSQERCEKLEKRLIEDAVTFPSCIEKTELQMTNVISTSKCKKILNCCSEVGDIDDFACKSLLLQSPNCVGYTQNNFGLSATSCAFVEKDSGEYMQEVTKALPGTMLDATCKSELDSSDELSQVPVGMQNERLDKSNVVGEALAKDSMHSFVEIASSVENHNCSVTKNVDSDVICSGRITSSDSHSALNEASNSLLIDECRTFNGNFVQDRRSIEDDLKVKNPDNLTLFGTCLECEIADVNCGSLLPEKTFHGMDQNCNLQNILEANPTVYDSSMIPLEMCNISHVTNSRQIHGCAKEAITSSNLLQVEDVLVQEPDCNVPVESCIDHMQVVSNQFTTVAPEEKSEEAELPNFCIVVGKVAQINQSLSPDNCLLRERTALAEFKGNAVFEGGLDAVPKTIDASESELESSRRVCSTPPQVHGNGDIGDIYNSASHVACITPGCVEVEPSSERSRLVTGSRMKHEVEHGGLLVEDLTSSRNRNQGANILKKSTLPDEMKAKVAKDISSLTEESHIDLDAASCLAKDKDTTAPIKKSESSSSKNSARIIPPTNAVPFSDEWLAVMEAAGEDILKMKSGAVQNSPTEKPLPEPSPWSPVRRKNNPIGPFDCTKFTNNLPSDSQ